MIRSCVVEHVPRLWLLWAASRPSQLALVALLYVLGVGLSTVGPPFVASEPTANALADLLTPERSTRIVAGGAVLVVVATAVHYANEYADADTDALADRTPFSGGSGALVETGLPESALRTPLAGACVVAVSGTVGGFVTGTLSLAAVTVLFVVLAAGLAYSLPPLALVRRSVGEPVNMVLGGLLVPVYGVAVVASPTPETVAAVVPFTLVVGCNLLAVHWPDRRADATVGKRTLAVRWGPRRIRNAYALLAVLAAASTVGLWWAEVLPPSVALAHLAPVPFLGWGWARLTRQRSPLPAVAAMVVLAVATTAAWWWVGLT